MRSRAFDVLVVVVGIAATIGFIMLFRDLVTTDYAGYEVGLARGATILVGVIAAACWVVLAWRLRRRD